MNNSARFANIVLGSITFLFFSMFFYILWKSNFRPSEHISGIVISITGLLFFSFVLLKCSDEFKVKVALLMFSLIFSMYAIELIFLYNSTSKKTKESQARIAEYYGIAFDSRAVIQVTADLRNQGVDAYPLYNPVSNMDLNETEVFSLGFISNKKTVYCNESGEYVIYSSDEHGFNNPKGLYNERTLDYILIGDSFAQGACVKREENIAGRLSKTGKILNLGMLNSGPLNQLAILKEYGIPHQPKSVLWLFYEGNDHEGLEFEKQSPFILNYLKKDFSQDLINKQDIIDKILINNVDSILNKFMEWRRSFNNNEIQTIEEKTEEINKNIEEAGLNVSLSTLKLPKLRNRLGMLAKCKCKVDPLLKEIIAEAKNTVDGWGGKLYFIYLPAWERYPDKTNYCRKRFLDSGKKEITATLKELQIPLIDIVSVFDSYPDPLSLFPFRSKGHYNPKGYSLVAKQIEQYFSINQDNREKHF